MSRTLSQDLDFLPLPLKTKPVSMYMSGSNVIMMILLTADSDKRQGKPSTNSWLNNQSTEASIIIARHGNFSSTEIFSEQN